MPSATARVAMLSFAGALASLASSHASAQRTSSLSWVRLDGAEHCISTQALAQRVEARIGRRVFVSASQADLSLEGHVQREGDSLVVRLVVSDPDGEVLGRRSLRVPGTDCTALEASLVLVIAIGIDPDAALPPETRGDPTLSEETKTMLAQLELPKLSDRAVLDLAVPDPSRPAPAAVSSKAGALPGPSPDPSRSPPASDRAAVELGLHAGLNLEFGVLPDPGLGLVLRITFSVPPLWPTELSITGSLPQSQSFTAATSSGEFQFWAAGLAVCPLQLDWGTLGLDACAGARAGALHSRGRGFRQPLSAAATWVDANVQAGPTLRLDPRGRFRLELRGRIALPFIRDTFVYQDSRGDERPAHRAGVAVFGVELGAGFFF